MERSAPVFLVFATLIATPAFCATFAAHSGPLHPSTVIEEPRTACDENASTPAAGEQQDARIVPCESQEPAAEQDDRSYLLETASPGSTMIRQGPELAIARLNPEFVARLASAIREARQSGLLSAGIFSAYRQPAFGVGGFLDKFKSLHSYGLAVDMSGIGEPGSKEAKLWHDIAARHGIFCPYRVDSKTEWNHCQAIASKKVLPDNPLRRTITAEGPLELEEMFEVGNLLIDNLPAAIGVAVAADKPDDSATAGPGAIGETAVSKSERPGSWHLRQARNGSRDAFARGRRRTDRKKTIVLAGNDVRHLEKSHLKVSARGHRDSSRRHSHSA